MSRRSACVRAFGRSSPVIPPPFSVSSCIGIKSRFSIILRWTILLRPASRFRVRIRTSPHPSLGQRQEVTLEKLTFMLKQEPKRVLAVVSDLFFSVKLSEAAKRNGLALEFVKEGNEVLEKAKTKPALIVFDLNFESVSPLALIANLKGNAETKGISLIGYLSHIQGELKMQAQAAGCDMVL